VKCTAVATVVRAKRYFSSPGSRRCGQKIRRNRESTTTDVKMSGIMSPVNHGKELNSDSRAVIPKKTGVDTVLKTVLRTS